MAALVSRRGSGRSRRAMNEINMVPFIDVMLVLLIIFMVSAPLITTGIVDLPTVGKSAQRPTSVIEIIVNSNDQMRMRIDSQEPAPVVLDQISAQVQALQAGNADVPVVISADRSVRYESVVKVMDTLQRSGVRRVGLSVKQGG
ncbi:MAG: ExbD/TolR family protein [Betaproteobacteria bacterium]|jgi:biopolymer transport protein TolR|nr:ExbD/TolR family protein [Betaproteobacteria bacterium]